MKKVLVGAFAALAALCLLGVTTSGYPQRPTFQRVTVGVGGAVLTNSTTSLLVNSLPVFGTAAAAGTQVSRVVSTQFKGGNTDRASTTTLADDVTLVSLSIPEIGTYIIDAQLCFQGVGAGTGGFKYRFQFSGSLGASSIGMFTGIVNGATVSGGNVLFLNANQVSFATTSTTGDCVRTSHTMNASATGTLSLQWAQVASDVNAARLGAGSAMWVTRIG